MNLARGTTFRDAMARSWLRLRLESCCARAASSRAVKAPNREQDRDPDRQQQLHHPHLLHRPNRSPARPLTTQRARSKPTSPPIAHAKQNSSHESSWNKQVPTPHSEEPRTSMQHAHTSRAQSSRRISRQSRAQNSCARRPWQRSVLLPNRRSQQQRQRPRPRYRPPTNPRLKRVDSLRCLPIGSATATPRNRCMTLHWQPHQTISPPFSLRRFRHSRETQVIHASTNSQHATNASRQMLRGVRHSALKSRSHVVRPPSHSRLRKQH